MTEKGKSKKEIEEELESANEQITQLSEGYQQMMRANQNMTLLVNKYEETINLLTARLLEARASQPL